MTPLPTPSSRPPSAVVLLLVGAGLLALACTSFGLSFLALGAFALPIALCIAAAKAAIVLVVFMDFAKQSASVKLAALAALLMVALLAGLMAADSATREPSPLIAPIGANQNEWGGGNQGSPALGLRGEGSDDKRG
jgi:cytochrome c oxidase subunit IV